ncbi:MAG TPA: SpoIIE family protein phosphatase [Spirochaetota bacterium]|nr:SpoIIE family protein phosphatase [Spirochaetota bacterium]HQF06833.1 SpoIIE family protein phosphatase [Spirochaetota bacterium]HQH95548.1 SpoIIE family protein phosphatase [Spirochaetota bacterium]
MSRKKIQIRRIIFGIRFKFSIIIILAVLFVSVLIGFSLLNQHEKKIKDSLQQQGATILEGISDEAQIFLSNKHALVSDQGQPITPAQKAQMAKQQAAALKKISQYFSSIVGKEALKEKDKDRILDIAFMVDCNWRNIGIDWKQWDQTLYVYFNRVTGAPFMQKNGRNDPLLEPTIVAHYMNTIDTGTYIGFASVTDVQEQFKYLFTNKPDYVIVGIPIFRKKPVLYDDYLEFQRQPLSKKNIQQYVKQKRELPQLFIKNILSQGLNLDYSVGIDSEKHIQVLFNFLLGKSDINELNRLQINTMSGEFSVLISKNLTDGRIRISRVISLWESLQKKLTLPALSRATVKQIHSELPNRLMLSNIPLSSDKPLSELALLSFRKDLVGILGLFLYRTKYFPEMVKSQNEIINLMISILLRAIFLALLFPTFIIRSIKKLADGAIDIGKGNLNKKIEIAGSDEIGRLADIFNVMTLNLKKAEDMKIEKIRMEKELLTAQQIQAALLPDKLPDIKGVEFGAYYSAQTESGGDYYDFIDLGNGQIGVTIADVSGHGVGSGLVMAMTRTLLHTYCTKTSNTKKILEAINDYLKKNTASNYFVTMFYGILDIEAKKLTYSSAGHCEPVIIRNGKIIHLPAGGIALGAVSGDIFTRSIEIREIQLQQGDYFIQYTDGVDEAMDSGNNEFGLDRFEKALTANDGKMPQDMIQSIVKEMAKFTGNIPQHDDITMIIFRII